MRTSGRCWRSPPVGKTKLEDGKIDMPRAPQVGDRVHLKEERRDAYRAACRAAGWTFDAAAIYTIIREDHHNPGGGRRLFIDVAPFCLGSSDVKLAWSNPKDRREMLRAKGHRV